MPKEIKDFYKKDTSYADIRRANIEKRRKLLEELHIPEITDSIINEAKKKKKEKEIVVEYTGPIRKSRRLQGEAPEIELDEFYMKTQSREFIPNTVVKEREEIEENKISYDGNYDAAEVSTIGDINSFFETIKMKKGDTDREREYKDVEEWTKRVQYSGAKKVVKERIYSMAIHPSSEKALICVGDKGGELGFWNVPNPIEENELPLLENGMKDISEVGDMWQFRLSKEPLTRLFYGDDGNSLFSVSYDKSIKRFDMLKQKCDTVFKLPSSFESDIFIHHSTPLPTNPNSHYVSLSNGEVLMIDIRDKHIQSCFQAHTKKVNTIDFHPNQWCMVTASLARSVKLWDIRKLPSSYSTSEHYRVKDPECEKCIHCYDHPLSVNCAYFDQSGDMVVTTCQDNHLRVPSEECVKIQHRNQTGKWLTKLMALFYKPANHMCAKEGVLNYFYCGSMDEPRQVNLYSVGLLKSKKPVVKALPSLFSPHIASIQSVVKMHPSIPLLACGNTSGRIVVLAG